MPNKNTKKADQQNKVIALTLGDPQGIGPEIIQKSLDGFRPTCALLIVGNRRFFAADIPAVGTVTGLRRGDIAFLDVDGDFEREDPSFLFVKAAADLACRGEVQALVTAPVSKDKWLRGGHPYRGHTEFFAGMAAGAPPAMFFWSDPLKVALFTHHLPLRDVFARLQADSLIAFVRQVNNELRHLFGRDFTYLISGLNPHAGENGHLGHEEEDIIVPALRVLSHEMPVAGLFSPDVVFIKAMAMKDAVVIAMTHDQGLIPFKLLHAGSGVQLTLGLPFIRTSPVHGTAYDIAGRNIANPASMLASLRLAEALLDERRTGF